MAALIARGLLGALKVGGRIALKGGRGVVRIAKNPGVRKAARVVEVIWAADMARELITKYAGSDSGGVDQTHVLNNTEETIKVVFKYKSSEGKGEVESTVEAGEEVCFPTPPNGTVSLEAMRPGDDSPEAMSRGKCGCDFVVSVDDSNFLIIDRAVEED